MLIGWDISSIPFGTGVSRYTANLVKAVIHRFPQEMYTVFGASLRQKSSFIAFNKTLPPSVRKRIYPLPPKLESVLFNQLHLPIELFTGRLDIFHSWDWYTPKVLSGKLITTIHDLSALKLPQDTHPDIVAHHKQALLWIKKEAAAIIAVSQATKTDIVELLNIEEKRVHIVYEALPIEHRVKINKENVKKVLKKYSITKPYMLIVASQEPRKNFARMIQAWEIYQKDYQLVVIGKPGYGTITQKPGMILINSLLNGQEIAALYAGASCFLYASLYEGFGLPILEAFFHKVPVVTSNRSSMPEVAGNAAVLVTPTDTDAITNGIKKALNQKQTLIKKGVQQLTQFSWEKAAKETMAVYQSVL